MAGYWLKTSADAQAEGPLSAAEVKRRAASGAVVKQTLISMDNLTFHPAGRVKGLFAPTPRPAAGNGAAVAASATATETAVARPIRGGGVPPSYPGSARSVSSTVMREIPPPPHAPTAEIVTPPPPMIEQGDGTIESQPAMPIPEPVTTPTPPPSLPPPLSAPPTAARAPLPPSLGYATPGVTGHLIAARRTGAFLIIAMLMLPVGLVEWYGFYLNFAGKPADAQVWMTIGAAFTWTCLSLAALLLWLFWLSGVHRDIRVLNSGHYGVSPAKAAGFFFIPIFNLFWAIFAPSKLAGAVNKRLQTAGEPPISRGLVVTCQVFSLIAPWIGLYAIAPLMYAITMRTIQRGLNRLVALQYTR